jgi:hypothetical protein
MSDYLFLSSNIKQPESNITFSDLWINSNYLKFKKFISDLHIPVNLIVNENYLNQKFAPFPVGKIFPIKNNCVYYYENNKHEFIKQISNFVKDSFDELFFISAGPLSEIIIHNAYLINPNNKYIDIGSALDEFIHGKITRPYMITGSKYSMEKVLWE